LGRAFLKGSYFLNQPFNFFFFKNAPKFLKGVLESDFFLTQPKKKSSMPRAFFFGKQRNGFFNFSFFHSFLETKRFYSFHFTEVFSFFSFYDGFFKRRSWPKYLFNPLWLNKGVYFFYQQPKYFKRVNHRRFNRRLQWLTALSSFKDKRVFQRNFFFSDLDYLKKNLNILQSKKLPGNFFKPAVFPLAASFFLKKTRLFFFFNYFYRRQKFLLLVFKKFSLFSNFAFRVHGLKEKFLKKNLQGQFFQENFSLVSFLFFLIWALHRARKRRPYFYSISRIPFPERTEEDWDSDAFFRSLKLRLFGRIRRKTRKMKRRGRQGRRLLKQRFFYGHAFKRKFFRRFAGINWDFLISYLIDRFFFKFNVDIKYFLFFLFFFRDFDFSSTAGSSPRRSGKFSFFESLPLRLLTIHKEAQALTNYDFSLEPFLYRLVPFDSIKVFRFLIRNPDISALFLAKYFAIRLFTGHSPKQLIYPVVRSLKKIAIFNLLPLKKNNYVHRRKVSNFLSFRSFMFKFFLVKNFFLYKFLSLKLFKVNLTFFNFYLLYFLNYFFSQSLSGFFLIGFSKVFFQRKHAFNFFFSWDFNVFFEKIFNFFASILLYFPHREFFFFPVLFDDLFSNFTLIFFRDFCFSIDLSSIKTAAYFLIK